MPHLEQQGPPVTTPRAVRQTTPRVGITEALIAPGVAALPVVARRSSTDELFAALNIAGAAAGVLGEQAQFLIHQQRGVAIRQAKEELPGLLQSIQEREMLVPNGVDPGAHARAIVDERIDGSGFSKAAAQAYRDVLVPGLATGFVQEQQNIKNEQTSMALLSYKDAAIQATTPKEIQAILTEMRTELPDVPEALLLGIITEAGTAAANNGDMTRVEAVMAVLGDTNIEQQQKMIRTLKMVSLQRERTRRQDLAIRVDELREQRRLGMPLSAVDKIMELWVDNPEIQFDEDDRAIQFSNFLIFDARVSADAGDTDGVEEAIRLSKLDSTKAALTPIMLAAQTRADATARREGEEILSQMYVQQREGTSTFDAIEKQIKDLAQDDRLLSPSTWQDRKLTGLEQRRAGEDSERLREIVDRDRQTRLDSAGNNAHDAFNDTQDGTNAINLPDLVYTDLTGRQITVRSKDIADLAYKMHLDRLDQRFPEQEDEALAQEAQAEKFRLRLQFLVNSRHVDRDFSASLEAGASEDFTTITPDQVRPVAISAFQLWKELDAVGIANAHTTVGADTFYREARFAQIFLGMTEAEALIASGQPDRIVTTSPDGRPRISDDAINKAVDSSVVGEAAERDTNSRAIIEEIASFHMRKYGTAETAALKEAVDILDDDYMVLNGYTFRTRGINLSEGTIEIVGDILIDFYLSVPANAEIYTKDMLTIRHLETTGEIFVTRLNTGVPVEDSPRISIREMGVIGEKHIEATNKEAARIGSHKRVADRAEEQFRRIDFRENAFTNGWADRNDSLETIKKKGRPSTLMMPRGMWNVAFTNVTDRPTISESFDPTMPEGTRPVIVDIVSFIKQNQKDAISRARNALVRPPPPGPSPIPVPPGFQN